ncbi:MAG: hypothetical protein FWC39_07350 [Bacteroidetes bacterium]|nr:hypothetical protein [Bacteroidota bacterium]
MSNRQETRRLMGIVNFNGEGGSDYRNPFSGQDVSIVLDNTQTSTDPGVLQRAVRVAITRGWYFTADQVKNFQGQPCDGIVSDGIFIPATSTSTAVMATGQNGTVIDITQMMTEMPVRLKGIRIATNNADQLDEELQILVLDPKGQRALKRITPSAYKSESELNERRVSIPLLSENIVMGKDRTMVYNLKAGARVTITFFFEDRVSNTAQLTEMLASDTI